MFQVVKQPRLKTASWPFKTLCLVYTVVSDNPEMLSQRAEVKRTYLNSLKPRPVTRKARILYVNCMNTAISLDCRKFRQAKRNPGVSDQTYFPWELRLACELSLPGCRARCLNNATLFVSRLLLGNFIKKSNALLTSEEEVLGYDYSVHILCPDFVVQNMQITLWDGKGFDEGALMKLNYSYNFTLH